LFPHRRVRANLLYGAADDSGLAAVVAMLGIGHLLDRWPRTLSGGEARRVAIGRALLSDPAFLLLDEPLSSLDRPRRGEIMDAIVRVRDEAGLPILMVTHDPEEAERLGTRIVRV
jgi:molybdate transport system ATP-binding protein